MVFNVIIIYALGSAYSTREVRRCALEVEYNSNLSNLMILNVELHIHLISEFDSAHVKF